MQFLYITPEFWWFEASIDFIDRGQRTIYVLVTFARNRQSKIKVPPKRLASSGKSFIVRFRPSNARWCTIVLSSSDFLLQKLWESLNVSLCYILVFQPSSSIAVIPEDATATVTYDLTRTVARINDTRKVTLQFFRFKFSQSNSFIQRFSDGILTNKLPHMRYITSIKTKAWLWISSFIDSSVIQIMSTHEPSPAIVASKSINHYSELIISVITRKVTKVPTDHSGKSRRNCSMLLLVGFKHIERHLLQWNILDDREICSQDALLNV